jgi:hypothetical protein
MHALIRVWNLDPEHRLLLFPENMAFEEVELNAGVGNGAVDFLHHPDFTFDNFWQLTNRKIVWMSPEVFFIAGGEVVSVANFRLCFGYGPPLFTVGLPNTSNTDWDNDLHVCSHNMTDATSTVCIDAFQLMTNALVYFRKLFGYEQETSLDASWDNELEVYSRSVTDATTTACDYVFQLMMTTNTIWTHLKFNALSSVSTQVLSQFLYNSRDSGGNIRFEQYDQQYDLSVFSQDYLLVFRDFAGPNHLLELEIGLSPDWSESQIETVASFFQSCQCAVLLQCGKFPVSSPLIGDALRGDCDIVDLRLDNVSDVEGLVQVLGQNKSLVRLAFAAIRICDDSWTVLCQSLATHPKLKYLRLSRTFPPEPDRTSNNERKSRRTDVFLQMLQAKNNMLQELETRTVESYADDEFDERILSIIQPFLHVRAFAGKQTDPKHARLFARALCKVKLVSPELTWMLIRSHLPTILEFSKSRAIKKTWYWTPSRG